LSCPTATPATPDQEERGAARDRGLGDHEGHLFGVNRAVARDAHAQSGARFELAPQDADRRDGLQHGPELGEIAGGPHEDQLRIGRLAADVLEEEVLPGQRCLFTPVMEALDAPRDPVEDARPVLPERAEAVGALDRARQRGEQDGQLGPLHQRRQQRAGPIHAIRQLVELFAVEIVEAEVVVEGVVAGEPDARVAIRGLGQPRAQLLGSRARVVRVVCLHQDHQVVLQLGEGLCEGEVRLARAQLRREQPIRIGVHREEARGQGDGAQRRQRAEGQDPSRAPARGLDQAGGNSAEEPLEARHRTGAHPAKKVRPRRGEASEETPQAAAAQGSATHGRWRRQWHGSWRARRLRF
jgi:hypothetical protein